MNSKFYITMDIGENKGAFSKARHDIEMILDRNGYNKIVIKTLSFKVKHSFVREMIVGLITWFKIIFLIPNYSIIFFQHPMPFSIISYIMIPVLKLIKKAKIFCVIHDIYSFRDKKNKFKVYYRMKDIGLLNRCDIVISHNDRMSEKLVECGVRKEILIPLEIFDYILCDENYLQERSNSQNAGIMIAGNLSGEKAKYLNLLDSLRIWNKQKILLYGPNFNSDLYKNNMNIIHKGIFKPEELPRVLDGSYGLVWDGDSLDECSGNIGEYLKINNPHKTSLYLAAGFPIIVWKESAMSDIVRKYNLGILIESLNDLTILDKITNEQYTEMRKNVNLFGCKLRKGAFFETALFKAEKICFEEKKDV